MFELVTSKVDLEMLKKQSIKVVEIFITGETFDTKDRSIIISALQLWEAIQSDAQQTKEIPFDKELIVKGLINCEDKTVRETFRDSISRIAKNQKEMFKFTLSLISDLLPEITTLGKNTW